MKKLICLFALLLPYKISQAQNLVPNGNFEDTLSCPTTSGQINRATNWLDPTLHGTADFYNQCNQSDVHVPDHGALGYQYAHSGVGYAAIWLTYYTPEIREFMEVPLTTPLIANATYHFEMYVNLSNYAQLTTDAIGAYFSDTLVTGVNNYAPSPFTAQINNVTNNLFDTLSWTLVSGNYTAHGGESYLMIGNFKTDALTPTVMYNPSSGYDVIYVYVDDVSLTQITGMDETENNIAISIYPNPVADKLTVTTESDEPLEIIVYDVASRKLLQQKFTNSISVKTQQLAKGVYVYEVRNKEGVKKKGKLVRD